MPLIMLTILYNASLKVGKVDLKAVLDQGQSVEEKNLNCSEEASTDNPLRRLVCNVKSPDEAGRVKMHDFRNWT